MGAAVRISGAMRREGSDAVVVAESTVGRGLSTGLGNLSVVADACGVFRLESNEERDISVEKLALSCMVSVSWSNRIDFVFNLRG